MSDENKEKKKIGGIDITVDTQRTEALARENERLKMEKEQAEKDPARFQKHFDLADKKLELYKEFGDQRFLNCNSEAECKELTTSIVKDALQAKKGIPAGTARCDTSGQMGIKNDLYTHRFESWEEMISTLREKAKTSHEAQSYLDEITRIAIKTIKDPNQRVPNYNPNDPENLPALVDFHGYKIPARKEEGDIGKVLETWRKERNKKLGVEGQKGENQ